ncbi:hypothetical protein SY83_12965 [Paenibacillus swuensis]|uniref:SAF domain-containing protein n=1 Tax=Paenibacillus swuensis TaxID=1178515 RepID=A0A172TJ16_9BACL|nr:SAF domain-containing protein [Paenibacillus swuensis]ANE47028.1 hypothetical protein SY83_12965 [Paenibacillus swuensis]
MHKWISALIGMFIMAGSVVCFIFYMKAYEQDLTMMVTYKPKSMIYSGELIKEEMIQQVEIPVVQHVDNAITNKSEIVGKLAAIPIGESEEFLSWKLEKDNIFPQEGESYYGFEVTGIQAVNNMLRRGDRIQVWTEIDPAKREAEDAKGGDLSEAPSDASNLSDSSNPADLAQPDDLTQTTAPDPASPAQSLSTNVSPAVELILQDVKVASVKDTEGHEITDAKPTTLGNLKGLTPEERDQFRFQGFRTSATGFPATITLIMTPAQYNRFTEGRQRGILRFGLDNPFLTLKEESTREKGAKP